MGLNSSYSWTSLYQWNLLNQVPEGGLYLWLQDGIKDGSTYLLWADRANRSAYLSAYLSFVLNTSVCHSKSWHPKLGCHSLHPSLPTKNIKAIFKYLAQLARMGFKEAWCQIPYSEFPSNPLKLSFFRSMFLKRLPPPWWILYLLSSCFISHM